MDRLGWVKLWPAEYFADYSTFPFLPFQGTKRSGPYCGAQGTLLRVTAAWMGEKFGGEWIHVDVWLNLFTVHLNYHNIVNWLYSD